MNAAITPGTPQRLSREATAALRSGPFHHALDLTIRDRGLTLEALHRRLANHGVALSLASLSYWRNGHRRPGRDSSLQAVRALEDILVLPPTALLTLLGQVPGPRHLPRNGSGPRGSVAGSSTTRDPDRPDLELISLHIDLLLGADRGLTRQRVRCVLLANEPGRHRFRYPLRAPLRRRPLLGATGCLLGRTIADPVRSCLLVEVAPDHPMAAGETCVLELELRYPGVSSAVTHIEQDVGPRTRELVMRAHFDPAARPLTCRQEHTEAGRGITVGAPTRLGVTPVAGMAVLHPRPGRYGLRWRWPQQMAESCSSFQSQRIPTMPAGTSRSSD